MVPGDLGRGPRCTVLFVPGPPTLVNDVDRKEEKGEQTRDVSFGVGKLGDVRRDGRGKEGSPARLTRRATSGSLVLSSAGT